MDNDNVSNTVFLITFQGLGLSSFGLLSLAKAVKNSGEKVLIFGSELDIYDFWAHYRIQFLYKLIEYKPRVVGLSIMSMFADMINEVSSFIKRYSPETKIFVGGTHALIYKGDILAKNPDVDYVFIGEGEEKFIECVKLINEGKECASVTGIAYRSQNGIVFNGYPPHISSIEIDFLDVLDDFASFSIKGTIENYMVKKAYSLMLSRGCPYECAFCAIQGNPYMKKMRFAPLQKLEVLLKDLRRKGVSRVYIHDAELNLNKEWSSKIIDAILKHGVKLSFAYLRIDLITREFLEKIKPAVKNGMLKLAIESGSDRIRNKILNKKITNDEIYEAFKSARELGICVEANYIVGSPDENLEDLLKTKEMHLKLPPMKAVVHTCSVLPGTELFEKYRPRFSKFQEFDTANPDLLIGACSSSKRLSFHNMEPGEFLFRVKELRDIVGNMGYYFRTNFDLKDKNICILGDVEASAVNTLLNSMNIFDFKKITLISSCMPDNRTAYKNVEMIHCGFDKNDITDEINKKDKFDYLFVVTNTINPRKNIRRAAALLKSKKRIFLELDAAESDFFYLADKRFHNIHGVNFYEKNLYNDVRRKIKMICDGISPNLLVTVRKIAHLIVRV